MDTRRRKQHSKILFGLLGTSVLFLTGCFRIDTTIKINNDGSSEFVTIRAVDSAAAAFGEENSEEATQICEDAMTIDEAVPENIEVEPYQDGTFCGLKVTIKTGPGEDPIKAISEIGGDAELITADNFEVQKIADDRWEATLKTDGEMAALGGSEITSEDELEDPNFDEEILKSAELIYRIELPGVPSNNNADSATETDGRTLFEWDVDLSDENQRDEPLKASTKPAGSSDDAVASTTPDQDGSTDGSEDDKTSADAEVVAPDDANNGEDSSAASTETNPDGANLQFADEAGSESSKGRTVLILGMLAIIAALAGVVFFLLKWPGRNGESAAMAGAAGPGPDVNAAATPTTLQRNPFASSAPERGPLSNTPPRNTPAGNMPSPSGPPTVETPNANIGEWDPNNVAFDQPMQPPEMNWDAPTGEPPTRPPSGPPQS